MNKNRLFILATTALLFCGCHHTEPIPEGILDTATMTKFLTEVYQLEAFYAMESNNNLDSMSQQISLSYNNLLNKYKLDLELFEKNLTYYSEHADLYDSIDKRIHQTLSKTPIADTLVTDTISN